MLQQVPKAPQVRDCINATAMRPWYKSKLANLESTILTKSVGNHSQDTAVRREEARSIRPSSGFMRINRAKL